MRFEMKETHANKVVESGGIHKTYKKNGVQTKNQIKQQK